MARVLAGIGVAALVGLAGAGGYALSNYMGRDRPPPASAAPPPQPPWVASAPGRVEAKSGDVKIAAMLLGRVAHVRVPVNSRVEADELLVQLDDDEARARLASAEAEAGARQRERDAQPAVAGREDIRKTEDAVFQAERSVAAARQALDSALQTNRAEGGGNDPVSEARKRLAEARDRLRQDRSALVNAQARPGLPAPNRLESAVVAARADVVLAQLMLDRTRIRAPIGGTVLQVNVKPGELVTPSPEQPVIVMSDPSTVIVKAEVDERDVTKVRVGQRAFVRSSAFPNKDFEGRVTSLSPALGPPRMTARGPRRPTDLEVLEVTIEFDASVPLLPGLRLDVYFRRED